MRNLPLPKISTFSIISTPFLVYRKCACYEWTQYEINNIGLHTIPRYRNSGTATPITPRYRSFNKSQKEKRPNFHLKRLCKDHTVITFEMKTFIENDSNKGIYRVNGSEVQ